MQSLCQNNVKIIIAIICNNSNVIISVNDVIICNIYSMSHTALHSALGFSGLAPHPGIHKLHPISSSLAQVRVWQGSGCSNGCCCCCCSYSQLETG